MVDLMKGFRSSIRIDSRRISIGRAMAVSTYKWANTSEERDESA